MKVRSKKTGDLGYSSKFNLHAMSEIIVYFEEGDCDSAYIDEYDVFLESTKTWKPLNEAFRDRDIITDNYNSEFREPRDAVERERGWYY
ncbi:MAG TPA: hypothetical protein PKA28_10705 [Methylomusa anaerophila]|uniref:Uncharacterized protein n=1 Tax=Methylomusa anaerophila TaxID=1930071 RepID=A0A348AIY6_9FIRM|nr:hypothetical protein [Methylomusa anaerophila]BBB91034.1 hypothetical protein MAMMFC1_01702 [Methylomusa anaerophila]HML88904.1 hypothetical protein [Methylomusa anaerophila]